MFGLRHVGWIAARIYQTRAMLARMRLLGAIRLSNLTDDTTSPERQENAIRAFASAGSHTITAITADLDVSGKIPPHERKELGPWLKEPKLSQWDAIVVTKPDRLSRSLRDFLNLLAELDKHGKSIISLDPNLDFSTPMGRLVANVLMSFAEFEREMISSRIKDAHAAIVGNKGYAGGSLPFGYMAVKGENKGWIYEQDPLYAPIVKEMASKILGGASMRQVATWLNSEDIPTSQNVMRLRSGKPLTKSKWQSQHVSHVLENPAITGAIVIDGKPMRDADGMIVTRCEGILDFDTWQKVNAACKGPDHTTYRKDANPLLRVAFCGLCGAALHTSVAVSQKYGTREYFICHEAKKDKDKCAGRSVPQKVLISYVYETLLDAAGDVPMRIKHVSALVDNTDALAQVRDAIDNIMSDRYERGLFTGDAGNQRFAEMMTRLEQRQAALEAAQTQEEITTWDFTGEKFAAYFGALDIAGKRNFMLGAGVRVYVSPDDGTDNLPMPDPSGRVVFGRNGKWRIKIHLGDVAELRDLAASQAA